MRILLGMLFTVLLCLPSLSQAAVIDLGLLDVTLTASDDLGLGARQSAISLLDDAGAGSDAGVYLLEGCASLATQFTSALALGLALGVGILTAGSEQQAVGMFVVGTIVGSLLIPLATSGVVYAIARGFGGDPSYGRIVLFSYGTRLAFTLMQFVLPGEAAVVASVIGMFAGAVAEVYAANSSFSGAGGDVARTVVHAPEARPLARQVSEPALEKRAPGPSLAFAF